jgi:hypothetical protein
MSQENVELAERATEAHNQRDLSIYDELISADFELYTAVAGKIEGGAIQGRESLQRYYEMLDETWEEFRLVPDEFRDLGDRVLILGRTEGRGRGSGCQWMLRGQLSMTSATEEFQASGASSITARRCGRRASPMSGQVPDTSASSWMRACR